MSSRFLTCWNVFIFFYSSLSSVKRKIMRYEIIELFKSHKRGHSEHRESGSLLVDLWPWDMGSGWISRPVPGGLKRKQRNQATCFHGLLRLLRQNKRFCWEQLWLVGWALPETKTHLWTRRTAASIQHVGRTQISDDKVKLRTASVTVPDKSASPGDVEFTAADLRAAQDVWSWLLRRTCRTK